MMKYILLLFALVFFTGCSAVDIKQYGGNKPHLNLFDYFAGETKGYGIVQDRKGTLKRMFTVVITGTTKPDGNLELYEKFDWNDGEKTTRTWIISKNGEHIFTGSAGDTVKPASGAAYGNVLNWQYQLYLEVDDRTWKIMFDDWMFLVTEQVLINRAKMKKFGLTVGEVTIVFNK